MYLLDDENALVDSEFSLGILNESPCVIIESSGGANPTRGVPRRNPDYNRLIGLILKRLAAIQIQVTAILLDSSRVVDLAISDRIAKLDRPYPIDLSTVDIDQFRTNLGRVIALMHRAQDAKNGGNAQRRIRICLCSPVVPEQLLTAHAENALMEANLVDYAPGHNETERAYIRNARIGQGQFRKALLDAYQSTCPILGISNPDLLMASHIKPWNACTNQERLDPNNGILLSPLIDKLFDRGLITFEDDGAIRQSPCLSPTDRIKCLLDDVSRFKLSPKSAHYMEFHRVFVYRHAAQSISDA